MVSKKRLFFIFILLILVSTVVFNWGLLYYGYGQLKGQLYVIKNSEEIEDVLNQEDFPDSLKAKLKLVQEVKQFAETELGLKKTSNYETVFNQKGEPILWVVTAAEKYRLKEYTWEFPLLGEVGYKGFFEFEKAEAERDRLKAQGLDTDIREVMAWSTLGWFKDPVLTNFLNKEDYKLVNLIIHELTHSSLYLPDSVTFNENFANFVAHEGTVQFLEKYNPELLPEYLSYHHDDSLYSSIVLETASQLAVYYSSFQTESLDRKEKGKAEIILKGISLLKKGDFINKKKYSFDQLIKELPNNAYYLSFIRYESKQDYFFNVYKENCSDLKKFMEYLIEVNSK